MDMKLILYFIISLILSCSKRLTLDGMTFYTEGKRIEFKSNLYFIHLKNQYAQNDSDVLIEEGKYAIRDGKVILHPQIKIECENKREIKFIDGRPLYPCAGIGPNYYNGYYVNKDTIETDLFFKRFAPYEIKVRKYENKLVLDQGRFGYLFSSE